MGGGSKNSSWQAAPPAPQAAVVEPPAPVKTAAETAAPPSNTLINTSIMGTAQTNQASANQKKKGFNASILGPSAGISGLGSAGSNNILGS